MGEGHLDKGPCWSVLATKWREDLAQGLNPGNPPPATRPEGTKDSEPQRRTDLQATSTGKSLSFRSRNRSLKPLQGYYHNIISQG
jgi:hypothetical protein